MEQILDFFFSISTHSCPPTPLVLPALWSTSALQVRSPGTNRQRLWPPWFSLTHRQEDSAAAATFGRCMRNAGMNHAQIFHVSCRPSGCRLGLVGRRWGFEGGTGLLAPALLGSLPRGNFKRGGELFAPSLNLSVPAEADERVSTTTALTQKQWTSAWHRTSAQLRSSGTDRMHQSTHACYLFLQYSYYLMYRGWVYDDACQRACLFPPLITVMIGSDAALGARKAVLCGKAVQLFKTTVNAAVMKRSWWSTLCQYSSDFMAGMDAFVHLRDKFKHFFGFNFQSSLFTWLTPVIKDLWTVWKQLLQIVFSLWGHYVIRDGTM